MDVRKLVVQVEETLAEAGRAVPAPSVKVVAAAVVRNPAAGGYVEDLGELGLREPQSLARGDE